MPYNPQYDLRGKRIEDTYQQVVQYDTGSGNSYNGQGAQLFISASFVPTNFPDITDVTASQQVGINQTNPQSTLDVGGNINASSTISASGGGFYSPGGGVLQVGANTLIETIGGTVIISAGNLQLSTFSGVQVDGRMYNDNGTMMLDDTANTSSVSYVNGFGGRFGVNTRTPQNALDVVGNISCSFITASINGTASIAFQAVSASWAPNPFPDINDNGSGNISCSAVVTASIFYGTASVSSTSSFSLATQDVTFSNNSVGLGALTRLSKNSVSVGVDAQATNTSSIAVGWGCVASGNASTAMGTQNSATSDFSIALGYGCIANNAQAIAIGYNADAEGVNSVAIGPRATTTNDNTIILGFTGNQPSVGIGTTTPNNLLQVAGDITANNVTASLFIGTSSFAVSASYLNGFSSSAAPTNQVTASAWMSVTVNGLPFFLPLYQ